MGKSNGPVSSRKTEMMDTDMSTPYFMTNKEWYYRDYDDLAKGLKLTDKGKALPEVVKSYEDYYSTHYDDDGSIVDY